MERQAFSLKKWAKSRKGQKTIIILAFMIIPLLLLFVFTYLPFGQMVQFSFYKMKYSTPVAKREFVGLANYIDVFKRKDCFSALKLSGYYIIGALVQLALALYLATILSFKTKGGSGSGWSKQAAAVLLYYPAEYQDDRHIECDYVYYGFIECIRAALCYHRRCKRHRYLFRYHERDCTCQPEGRSGICDGSRTAADHFCGNDSAEAVLQICV